MKVKTILLLLILSNLHFAQETVIKTDSSEIIIN